MLKKSKIIELKKLFAVTLEIMLDAELDEHLG
jgi:hypothetical protein